MIAITTTGSVPVTLARALALAMCAAGAMLAQAAVGLGVEWRNATSAAVTGAAPTTMIISRRGTP